MLTAARRDFVVSIPDRGHVEPPPLAAWIEYRAESSPRPWLAFWPDGTLAEACASMAAAQAALCNVNMKEARNG